MEIVTLFRPVGKNELALIEKSDFTAFPPRLPEQPIFYPVLNEEYATQIARGWNAKYNADKVGYVTKFEVQKEFLDNYEVKAVGGKTHEEYWIPAENLEEFNRNILGKIKIIAEFRGWIIVKILFFYHVWLKMSSLSTTCLIKYSLWLIK